jgi:RNA polymerase sigma factor (TIGR02999 family)
MNDVSQLLSAIEQGDPQAASQLLPLVYTELRQLAAQRLASEAPGQTLEATALVHEAYLRLVASPGGDAPGAEPHWDHRGHFFAVAAEAMRRILVENARRKRSRKRGGRQRHDLDDVQLAARDPDDDLLAIDEALSKFAALDPVKAKLVKLRYFAGCTSAEAARLLGISTATAERYWAYARAWLHQEITRGAGPGHKASAMVECKSLSQANSGPHLPEDDTCPERPSAASRSALLRTSHGSTSRRGLVGASRIPEACVE